MDFILVKAPVYKADSDSLNDWLVEVFCVLYEGRNSFEGGIMIKKYGAITQYSNRTTNGELSALISNRIVISLLLAGKAPVIS